LGLVSDGGGYGGAVRFRQGLCRQLDGKIVGTLTVQRPQPDASVALYQAPTTRSLTQFAVAPAYQGKNIGKLLHECALASAAAEQALTLAIDTAEPAAGIISMYRKWGYEVCGHCDWRPLTNYRSVLMKRPITDAERAHFAAQKP
jgi:GNAT superfamily N-acetyltransferase